eukprot:SAG31_NODE_8003_length_1543_cov_1.665512_2_plen_141_part_01
MLQVCSGTEKKDIAECTTLISLEELTEMERDMQAKVSEVEAQRSAHFLHSRQHRLEQQENWDQVLEAKHQRDLDAKAAAEPQKHQHQTLSAMAGVMSEGAKKASEGAKKAMQGITAGAKYAYESASAMAAADEPAPTRTAD